MEPPPPAAAAAPAPAAKKPIVKKRKSPSSIKEESFLEETIRQLFAMTPRDWVSRLTFVFFLTATAIIIWKSIIILCWSEIPIVVVLSESMYPGYTRGDLLVLSTPNRPPEVGDITVFKLRGRDIPIVHRIHRMHISNTSLAQSWREQQEIMKVPAPDSPHKYPFPSLPEDPKKYSQELVDMLTAVNSHPRGNAAGIEVYDSNITLEIMNMTFAQAVVRFENEMNFRVPEMKGEEFVRRRRDFEDRERRRRKWDSLTPEDLNATVLTRYILTKGDNNYGEDHSLYNPGQFFISEEDIMGRSVMYLPYVGQFTILMADAPYVRLIVIIVLLFAIFVTNEE